LPEFSFFRPRRGYVAGVKAMQIEHPESWAVWAGCEAVAIKAEAPLNGALLKEGEQAG
jgi:hypothetical protein